MSDCKFYKQRNCNCRLVEEQRKMAYCLRSPKIGELLIMKTECNDCTHKQINTEDKSGNATAP